MKTPIGILGAGLLVAAALVAGCNDSAVDPASDANALKAYSAPIVLESELNDFSELPTPYEALVDCDSTGWGRELIGTQGREDGRRGGMRGGERGRGRGDKSGLGWKERGMGRDFGRLGMREYGRIFRQLELTVDQQTTLRGLMADYRDCAQDAAETYRTARAAALETVRGEIDAIRAQVEAGTMTTEDARTAIAEIIADYREEIEPLNTAFRAAVDACKATFEAAFEAILTPAQLELWLTLKG